MLYPVELEYGINNTIDLKIREIVIHWKTE